MSGTDFFDNIGGGAGVPTALLKSVGDFVHGTILEMFKRDDVPFGKTEPAKNADGTTKQQLVVIVQTENRNWANVVRVPKVDSADPNSAEKPPSDDDGKRAVYVGEGTNIQYAIGRSISEAKAPFEEGGTLGVKIVELKDTGKGNPLKVHEAVYKGKAAGDGFFPAPATAPAAPAPQAQAAPAPAAGDPWASQGSAATVQPPF